MVIRTTRPVRVRPAGPAGRAAAAAGRRPRTRPRRRGSGRPSSVSTVPLAGARVERRHRRLHAARLARGASGDGVGGGPGRGGRTEPELGRGPQVGRGVDVVPQRRPVAGQLDRAGGPVRRGRARAEPGRRPGGRARWPAAWSRCRRRRRTNAARARPRPRSAAPSSAGRSAGRSADSSATPSAGRPPRRRGRAVRERRVEPGVGLVRRAPRRRPPPSPRGRGRVVGDHEHPRRPPGAASAAATVSRARDSASSSCSGPRPAHRVQPGLGHAEALGRDDHGPPHAAPRYPPRPRRGPRGHRCGRQREDCAATTAGRAEEVVRVRSRGTGTPAAGSGSRWCW